MDAVPIFARDGRPISDLDGWEQLASTTGKWADGYSAKELARLWLDGTGPRSICDALQPVLPGLALTRAVAEAQVAFDSHRGGMRNHDVLAYGTADCGEVVVGVEGKVNEPLDDTIAHKYEQAQQRRRNGQNSNLDKRIDGLLDAIVGTSLTENSQLGELRYQLFSALAGTVAAAGRETAAAALVVDLIRTPLAETRKVAETRKAVRDFCQALGADSDSAGGVVGPIRLKQPLGAAPTGLPVWLTVIETDAASAPAP